ncbi:MAG: ferredoxin [bacterium]|nr:ferredoxin [bacterium]
MALRVDKEKCIGCMTCVSMFPNNFKIGEDGKSEVISQDNLTEEQIKTAISSCPAGAILSVDK